MVSRQGRTKAPLRRGAPFFYVSLETWSGRGDDGSAARARFRPRARPGATGGGPASLPARDGERPSLLSPSYNYLSVDACAPRVAQRLRCRASKDKRNRTKIIQHRRPPSVEVKRLALAGLPFLIGRRRLRRPALHPVLAGRPPCPVGGGRPVSGPLRLGWWPRRASSRRWPMCGGLRAA